MGTNRVISSDSHVFEPSDLWTSRVPAPYQDRAPRVIHREEDDTDWWMCDGIKGPSGGSGGSQAGKRFDAESAATMSFADKMENVRPGAYDPNEHLKDMDLDGIDVDILYPTQGLILYSVPDGELLNVLFAAYNDWLAEFCQAAPDRLKGIAMLNVDDVGVGVAELERCAKLGLIGAMSTVYPEVRPYGSEDYEPLWAAAQDLEMPLSLHLATNRPGPNSPRMDLETMPASLLVNVDHWVRNSLCDMIFTGVFERFPRLLVGSIEQELGWAPHFIDRLDYNYTQRPPSGQRHRFSDGALPSDFFRRNVFISFQDDALGLRDREQIGIDNIMWGSDYPHPESTFPHSQQVLKELLAACTEEESRKIVCDNVARVYGLD